MKMQTCSSFICALVFLFAGAAHAVTFELKHTPGEVIDGTRQKTILVEGFADLTGSGYYDDLKITATWSDSGIVEVSPVLGGGPDFQYTFPAGDAKRCGLVSFCANAVRKGVKYESKQKKYVFVDCKGPRVLIGKPKEGQVVRVGTDFPVEIRVEDDLLTAKGFSAFGLRGYTVAIDLDGQPVPVSELFANTPVLQKYYVRAATPGRHGIRVRFTDRVGKTDEKTVWIVADGTVPQVRVITPAANQTVTIPAGGIPSMTAEVEAKDPDAGIEKVEFYLDGVGVAAVHKSAGTDIYKASFGVAQAGPKVLTIKAFDKVGHGMQTQVNFNVVLAGGTAPSGKPPKPSRTLPR